MRFYVALLVLALLSRCMSQEANPEERNAPSKNSGSKEGPPQISQDPQGPPEKSPGRSNDQPRPNPSDSDEHNNREKSEKKESSRHRREKRPNPDGRRQHNNHQNSTIVHLFEWKWNDIAEECETFLAQNGYGGVQVSPPSENAVILNPFRPWWERYQVVSYELVTRSGNEEEFLNMSRRCNKVGVRIFVDAVVNHMTGNVNGKGTAGNEFSPESFIYPAVPYKPEDFHNPICGISNYNNATEVRICELSGLHDLNQTDPYVREQIVNYMNHLIRLGVAGFRVDAAKHMYPSDLQVIYSSLDDLSTDFGFDPNTRPYIYQEVIYYGGEAVKNTDYTPLGAVTEFRFGSELSRAFLGNNPLKWLNSWGPQWNLLPSSDAFVFIDNHDNQRGHGGGSNGVLTHKNPRPYKTAVGFMLAHPYGRPRVMSSFFFDSTDQGPPADENGSISSPIIHQDNTCSGGWVCEHRWREIYQMVKFREIVDGTAVEQWWDNGNNAIAFSRGDKGFVAFNIEEKDLNERIKTNLPPGRYCDVVNGATTPQGCENGSEITVDQDGYAKVVIPGNAFNQFLAIHVGPQSYIQSN